ncbi:MAG: hypothetical protein H0Z35_00275 [Thermoanaerobacteraceae bacterium]|nr:hypothetical protein [Thermoanaerobacteraceae bacterium]
MNSRKILLVVLVGILTILVGTTVAAASTDAAAKNQKCLQCHGNKDFSIKHDGETIPLYVDVEQYQQSIHGTNSCETCHADVQNIPHKNVVYGEELERKIDQRCQTCHGNVNKEYRDSIHGMLQAEGKETAGCSDCHGSHNIRKKEDPLSLVNRTNITETCTKCHDGHIAESYAESFHGKAVSLGSTKAATCVDCHTGHSILGPEDPKSTVHKDNIPETCASCHNQAQPNFAEGVEHWTFEPDGPGKPMYYTLKFFTWLTIITIVLLIIHIELELFRRYRDARRGS